MSEKLPASPKRKPRSPAARKAARTRKLRSTYRKLEAFDGVFLCDGSQTLVGIDEAGRGALAGPVVAAAVVLPRNSELVGVNDSKLLSAANRERLFRQIVDTAESIGIGMSQPGTIDRENILNATLIAMGKAYRNLRRDADIVLLDGRDGIELATRVVTVVRGDGKSLSVAAASIVAKVARDRVMNRLHRRHPEYNFMSNKGYGTKEHLDAIIKYGAATVHRKSYHLKAVEELPSLF